jgi:hypothetical protein
MTKVSRWFNIVAIAVSLSGVLLLLSTRLADYYEIILMVAHQKRSDCLTSQSTILQSCKADLVKHPIDFDFCSEAVSICKQKGFYSDAESADRTMQLFEWAEITTRWMFVLSSASMVLILFGLFLRRIQGLLR